MEIFTKSVADFFNTRKQDVISNLNRDNAEYAELRKTLNNDLSQSQDFERLKEDIHRLYDIESDYLYLQGFKDCISLLRLIEAL